MKLKLYNPLKNNIITQGFGENPQMYSDPKYGGIKGHNGIDYWATDGTPVYASHDGRVTFAGYDGAGGLGVVIRTNEEYFFDTDKQMFISDEEANKLGYFR